MKTNHITIMNESVVQLHGFEEIQGSFYVEIFDKRKYLLFITHERFEKDTCFKVSVDSNKQVQSKRLCDLIKEYSLENKRFLFDKNFHNYLSTNIEV